MLYSYFSNNVSINTYDYLLKNNHFKAITLFKKAIESDSFKVPEQLLDLILSYEVDFNSLYSLPATISFQDLEKCLNNGLTLNQAAKLVLANTHNESSKVEIDAQEELIKFLSSKDASFIDAYSVPTYFSTNTYELMLDHGLKPEVIFRSATNLVPGEKRDELMDLALAHNIDFASVNSDFSNLPLNELEKCFAHGLSKEELFIQILKKTYLKYTPDNIEYETRQLTEKELQLIEYLKNLNTDFDKAFLEISETTYFSIDSNEQKYPYLIPKKILVTLIENYSLNPNLILEYGLNQNVFDIIKLSLDYHADVNYKLPDSEIRFFIQALCTKNLDIIELLIAHGALEKIDIESYIGALKSPDFKFAAYLINKYPNLYNNEELYSALRANGISESESKSFLDFHDLVNEYLAAKRGEEVSLGEIEIRVLDGTPLLEDINIYQNANITNKYGYSLLHLSLMTKQFDFAVKLIENGADINAKTHNNILAIQMASFTEEGAQDSLKIAELFLDLLDSIDIDLGIHETLTDILIRNKALEEKVLEKTNDPLFALFKQNADLSEASNILDKTHIAISHGDDFWSTGVWSTARFIQKNYPNVIFHLVTDEMLKRGGENFIKQFDAVINPGAGDSYPKLVEFTKADCKFSMNIEMHYQNMLELTDKHNIPYLGMCAGAQHFAMYHGGTLRPLEGYGQGTHQITYIPGTLPYFMALTKEQQTEVLKNCELPTISFKGDTAHHFAAVHGKLGNDIELGALSEDHVPMSYSYINGIRYATQFHPEHYYGHSDNDDTIPQKSWLNNFIEIAIMHHEHKVNRGAHPVNYFAEVKERLDECLNKPTCLGNDSLSSYIELYS